MSKASKLLELIGESTYQRIIDAVIEGFMDNFGEQGFKDSVEVLDTLSNLMSEKSFGKDEAEAFWYDDEFRSQLETQLVDHLKSQGVIRR